MFDLPHSEQIDEELNVSPGTIQPFENGYITTWVGRRKTPYGHRLVRAGRIVGWLCEGDSATKLLGGGDARKALEAAEEGTHRLVGYACSLRGLGRWQPSFLKPLNFKQMPKVFLQDHHSQTGSSPETFLPFFPHLKDTITSKEHLQQIKEFLSIVQEHSQANLRNWPRVSHHFLIRWHHINNN